MAEAQNNTAVLNRKEWQTMTPAITTTAAGMFVIAGPSHRRYSMYVTSATVHYLYDHNNDDWQLIPSGALAGTFGAGATGVQLSWSPTYTATGGSTTTVTVNSATHNINGNVVGDEIEFLTGTAANIGLRRTVTAIKQLGGTGTTTITFSASIPSSVANNDTFRISSGSFFVLCPGTLASGSFRRYDIATGSWSTLTITGLSATWGTDGRLVSPYNRLDSYDSGTATSGSTTTLVDSGKAWTADQWINYQVRITGGAGVGQKLRITDNDATTLTFATATAIDSSSTYVIEGDENALYLLGNNAVTMYKYSISANTWATVSPTVARAGAPVAGMTADWIGGTGDTVWSDITDIKDGRYIFSLRGGGTSTLDRFDISGGTNGAGAWLAVTYAPSLQTFTTGSSSDANGKYIYIAKEGTAAIPQRFYKYDVVHNYMYPLATDWYLAGAAVLGNKIWIKDLSTTGAVKWLYCLQSTATNLRRIMLF